MRSAIFRGGAAALVYVRATNDTFRDLAVGRFFTWAGDGHRSRGDAVASRGVRPMPSNCPDFEWGGSARGGRTGQYSAPGRRAAGKGHLHAATDRAFSGSPDFRLVPGAAARRRAHAGPAD